MAEEERPIELERHFNGLEEPEKVRLLYVLDYVLNYKRGWRYVPKLSEFDFWQHLDNLIKIGVVTKFTETDYKHNSYEALKIVETSLEQVNRFLSDFYFPRFTEKEVREKVSEIIQQNLATSSRLLDSLKYVPNSPTVTIAEERKLDPESKRLVKELVEAGLGFPVRYTSASGSTQSEEFIFREKPLALKPVFVEILENEIKRRLQELGDPEKWCIYLRYLNPTSDNEFFILNKAESTREEIVRALKNPHVQVEKKLEIIEPVLKEIENRFVQDIRQLFLRDINFLTTLSVVFQLADTHEKFFKLRSYQLDKVKELSPQKYQEFISYLDDLHSKGIALKSNSEYWIPEFVKEIFTKETRGNILQVKVFTSRLDAETFFYDLFGKAGGLIRVWDPYFSPDTLRLLDKGLNEDKKLSIEILTSCPGGGYSALDDKTIYHHIKLLQKKPVKVSIKAIHSFSKEGVCLSPFHDRYIIIDNREVWSISSSLHSIGEKRELALQLKEDYGSLVIGAFNDYWNREFMEGFTIRKLL